MLVAEAVDKLAVVLGSEGEVAVRDGSLIGLMLAHWIRDLFLFLQVKSVIGQHVKPPQPTALSYPKINIEVSGSAKFSVTGLESDGHDIVLVELLVEAFATVGW